MFLSPIFKKDSYDRNEGVALLRADKTKFDGLMLAPFNPASDFSSSLR